VHVSPDHFQGKLNLAWRRLGGGDQSRRSIWNDLSDRRRL